MGLRIYAYRYIHFRSNRNQLLRSISVDLDMNIRIKSVILICQHCGAGKGARLKSNFPEKSFDRLLKDLVHLVLPAMVVEKKQSALDAAPFCSREALPTCYFWETRWNQLDIIETGQSHSRHILNLSSYPKPRQEYHDFFHTDLYINTRSRSLRLWAFPCLKTLPQLLNCRVHIAFLKVKSSLQNGAIIRKQVMGTINAARLVAIDGSGWGRTRPPISDSKRNVTTDTGTSIFFTFSAKQYNWMHFLIVNTV